MKVGDTMTVGVYCAGGKCLDKIDRARWHYKSALAGTDVRCDICQGSAFQWCTYVFDPQACLDAHTARLEKAIQDLHKILNLIEESKKAVAELE